MRNNVSGDQECPTPAWRSTPWLPVNPSVNSDVPLTVTLSTLYPPLLSGLESSRVSIPTWFGVFNFTHNSSSFIIDLKDIPLCRGYQGQGREEKLHAEEPPFQWDGWALPSPMAEAQTEIPCSQPDWCTRPFQNKQGEMLCLAIAVFGLTITFLRYSFFTQGSELSLGGTAGQIFSSLA